MASKSTGKSGYLPTVSRSVASLRSRATISIRGLLPTVSNPGSKDPKRPRIGCPRTEIVSHTARLPTVSNPNPNIIGLPVDKDYLRKQATQRQKEVLVEALQKNYETLMSLKSPNDQRRCAWEELAKKLNEMVDTDGPRKTVAEWRNVWVDMRLKVQKKNIKHYPKFFLYQGNKYYFKQSLDERVLRILLKYEPEMCKRRKRLRSSGSDDQCEFKELDTDPLALDDTGLRSSHDHKYPTTSCCQETPPISSPEQDPLLTTTLEDEIKMSPPSVDDCDLNDMMAEDPLENPVNVGGNQETDYSIPPEPYTSREMEFYHALRKAKEDNQKFKEERDFFKNEFIIMREMMQNAMNLLNQKREK